MYNKMIKITIFLLLLFLMIGCAPKNRDLENHQVMTDIGIESTSANYVKSPDGKHAISDSSDKYHILLYKDINKSEPKSFEIIGNDYEFLWSPNSNKVCISYSGRIWSDFSIIDMDTESVAERPTIEGIIKQLRADGAEINYELNENRPDPYLTPLEWSPDSKKILIFYTWFDKEIKVQNGIFIYDTESKRASRMIQYPPAEGEHTEKKIPADFKW